MGYANCHFPYKQIFVELVLWVIHVMTGMIHVVWRGRRDRMVVGFTTTCAISAFHH
jgi:hypothetical protein